MITAQSPSATITPTGEFYRRENGRRFYVGIQAWLKDCHARLTFLTTEALVSNVVITVFNKLHRLLLVLDLNARCGLFPVEVPLQIDKRAAKDRAGRPNITALADELLAASPDAIVIGNGIGRSDPRVKTFQRAKGLNGINENDVHIIATCISPEQYSELNVVGQWLALPRVPSAVL